MWQNQELWSLAQDHFSVISSKFRHFLMEAGEAFLDSESKQNLQVPPFKKMKHKLHTAATVGTSAGNRNLSSWTVHRDRGNTAFFSGHPCLAIQALWSHSYFWVSHAMSVTPTSSQFTKLGGCGTVSLACHESPIWHRQTLAHISIGKVIQPSFSVHVA